MVAADLAQATIIPHCERHRQFIRQVNEWAERCRVAQAIDQQQMVKFLFYWLIFHILGDDLSMARQMTAISAGMSPQAAYEKDLGYDDPRTQILLTSVSHLYSDLADRNESLVQAQHTLAALNESLELRVEERTRELEETHQRLKEEQARVLEAEKMASLGRMVAGFVHEVNTPIGVAVGATSHSSQLVAEIGQLIDQDEVIESDLRERLVMLAEAADLSLSSLRRASAMVQSFKRTAVDQTSDMNRDYDLAEVIEDVQRSMHGAFKNTPIQIEVDCPPKTILFGQAGALIQLLTNLLQNSLIHAFADGSVAGSIKIRANFDDNRVFLEYVDDGVGMSEAVLKQIFEPFFTTRRGSGGSGLGLYVAYNLAYQALHGSIRCESEPGRGTKFLLEIPRSVPIELGPVT